MSQGLQSFMIPGGGYGYTGTPVDDLTNVDNTVATAFFDESGSTRRYARQMELCVQEVIKSLRHSPAADKLIYRQVHFDHDIREFHGFKPLADCNEGDYDGCWGGGGTTDLYGCEDNVIRATLDYAEQQAAKHYNVNAIIYGITDGAHYNPGGNASEDDAIKAMEDAVDCEALESVMSILIGVNDSDTVQDELKRHAQAVGYTQYVPLKDADEKTLAKLANFISQSVQSQSQALGSGGVSQSLTF